MPDDRNDVPDMRSGFPSNGHQTNGTVHPTPFALRSPRDDAGGALDLVAVQADDELVTAVATRPSPARDLSDLAGRDGARPGAPGRPLDGATTDDRLVAMFAAWRAEIDAEPIPELVDLDTAVAAVVAGIDAQELTTRRRRAGRLRQLAPLAAAAAIIVATVTGVGLGSQNAVPGDTLWAIQKVVNPERAESVEAKVAVEGHLQKARSALQSGDTATAQQELKAIDTQISSVRGQEGRPALAQEQEFLTAKLVDTPPGTPADLSTPSKSNPTARSTSAPTPPPPSTTPSTTETSVSPSAGVQPSTEPDVRSSVPDRGNEAVAPARPGGTGPTQPAPESAPPVTSAPDVTRPDPTGPGKTEGGPDPRVVQDPRLAPPDPRTVPGPAAPPPPPVDQGGTDGPDTPTSKTTTASGSAGASAKPTATETAS